jgi:hypothetical protein
VKPSRLFSEIGGPSVWGGEKKNPAGSEQLGQNIFENSLVFWKSIDQVGVHHQVKSAEVFRDSKSIPSLKTDSFSVDFGRDAGEGWSGDFTFLAK